MNRYVRVALPLALLAGCGGSDGTAQKAPPPAAAQKPAFDPVADAASSFRVVAAITPEQLAVGRAGKLRLAVEITKPEVHVQKEFPLRVTLAGSQGIALSKTLLGHAEASDPAGRERHWEVALKGTEKGPQRVDVALRFAICRETEPEWCVVREEKVSASAEVR